MMKITKIFTFDSSHMLDGHDGKCQNLHGHTYKLEITVSGSPIEGGAKDGMVMDFSDLKRTVKQHIIEPFDHAFIYHGGNERENPAPSIPHHRRKHGDGNVRPSETRGFEYV